MTTISHETLSEMRESQNQYLKHMGLDPDVATEEDIIMKLNKLTDHTHEADEQTCTICFSSIEAEMPYYPCRCLFVKLHKKCLPAFTYTCGRCHTSYGKTSMRRPIVGRRKRRCNAIVQQYHRKCRNRQSHGEFCGIHGRMLENGFYVYRWNTEPNDD